MIKIIITITNFITLTDYLISEEIISTNDPSVNGSVVYSREYRAKTSTGQYVEFTLVSPGSAEIKSDCYSGIVSIDKPIYIMKWQLTRGEYASILGARPSLTCYDHNESEDISAIPTDLISIKESSDISGALEKNNTGMTFRIPTEAEWMYCAAKYGITKRKTADVNPAISGDLRPRPFRSEESTVNDIGMANVCGNLGEWCSPSFPVKAGQDLTGIPVNRLKFFSTSGVWIIKGGSVIDMAELANPNYRRVVRQDSGFPYTGLRLVCYPSQVEGK